MDYFDGDMFDLFDDFDYGADVPEDIISEPEVKGSQDGDVLQDNDSTTSSTTNGNDFGNPNFTWSGSNIG